MQVFYWVVSRFPRFRRVDVIAPSVGGSRMPRERSSVGRRAGPVGDAARGKRWRPGCVFRSGWCVVFGALVCWVF